MIHPSQDDDFWIEVRGVFLTYGLVLAVLTIVGLAGIGAYTVFTWLA
jgi:hypothetical protein